MRIAKDSVIENRLGRFTYKNVIALISIYLSTPDNMLT